MSSQLFKNKVPISLIKTFLHSICEYDGRCYVFSKTAFRKAKFHEKIMPFCELLIPYYHSSKKFYVTRDISYVKFATILRQLCASHNIPNSSRITYDKSYYEIQYYIFIES